MVTDGCSTGVDGLVSQGADWKTARIAAFYSAKLNSAQQNYPVHEIEMLAGVETMLRHRDILQVLNLNGLRTIKVLFICTINLVCLDVKRDGSKKSANLILEIIYVPGTENVVADALSRIYSNDSPATIRAPSEYTYHDVVDEDPPLERISMPDLAGIEARVAIQRKPRKKPIPAETGRPETSKEFAKRVKNRFVLKGPGERKEGNTTPNYLKRKIADH